MRTNTTRNSELIEKLSFLGPLASYNWEFGKADLVACLRLRATDTPCPIGETPRVRKFPLTC